MVARDAHDEVLRYCEREVVEQNPFHAMQEAAKGVAERLRHHTGFGSDGAGLIDACFAGNPALVQLTPQQTLSEESVQKGFANLLKGLFGHFRNPTAHAPVSRGLSQSRTSSTSSAPCPTSIGSWTPLA